MFVKISSTYQSHILVVISIKFILSFLHYIGKCIILNAQNYESGGECQFIQSEQKLIKYDPI